MDKDINELIENTSHKDLIIWAQDCAYHVLTFFEESHQFDLRPRKAIESIEKWMNNELTVGEVRTLAFSAHKAARESDNEISTYSARSAGHAAATIHVKTHAVHAANYALKVFIFAKKEREKEYLWQYERLQSIKKRAIK
jgi:hypothetical protein